MEAVILAGGRGTRLKPFTTTLPKPLVPVGERAIIEIVLNRLKKGGVEKVHIALNHLAHLIEAVVGDGSRFGLEVAYCREEKPLSTVGPLKLIADLPNNFIVTNGDILSDIDIGRLYRHHLDNGALVTVATSQRTEKMDFGVMEISDSGFITGFKEKPEYNLTVSMGIYVFKKAVLDFVPENEKYGFDDLMYELLRRQQPVGYYPYDGYWLDIGRPADYEQALRDIAIIEKF
jgi:NDP-sugar pyrophosphorylase family protein